MFALSYKLSDNGRAQMAKRKSREYLIPCNGILYNLLAGNYSPTQNLLSHAEVGKHCFEDFFCYDASLASDVCKIIKNEFQLFGNKFTT